MRPYLRAANVDWGGLKIDDVKHMNFTDAELPTYRLLKNDVLLTEASGSPDEVGKSAVWNEEIAECCFQNTLIRVRPHDVDARYISRFLAFEAKRGAFVERARGVGINHLGSSRLASWQVPIPPRPEQLRIVTAVHDQLDRLGRATESLRCAQDRTGRYVSATLKSMGESPDTDSSLDSVQLGIIARVGSGATPLKSNRAYYDEGSIPWVTSADLASGDIQEVRGRITRTALAETAVKLWPAGSLLIAMYGEGKTRGTVGELHIDATTNQACAAIDIFPQYSHLKSWIRLVLESRYEEMRNLSAGGVQPNLSLGLIRKIEIPLRPQKEREFLLQQVAETRSLAFRMSDAVARLAARVEALQTELMRMAFRGELINQDPTDEPADVLLARIRADREAASVSAKTTRRTRARKAAAP